jgi:hypothetical protein
MVDDRFSLAAALALLMPVEGERPSAGSRDGDQAKGKRIAGEITLQGLELIEGGKGKGRPVKRRSPPKR